MRDNGIRRAAVFTTSAWSGYSSCTQYVRRHRPGAPGGRTGRARTGQTAAVLRPSAFRRDVRRHHRAAAAPRTELPPDARLVFTAHSVPVAADQRCGPQPLQPPSRVMPQGLSRRPRDTPITTWPGSRDRVRRRFRGWSPMSPTIFAALAATGTNAVIVCPIGFVADHIEVVWDLDHELRITGRGGGHGVRAGRHAQRRPAIRPAGRGPDRRTALWPCARPGDRPRSGAGLRGQHQRRAVPSAALRRRELSV